MSKYNPDFEIEVEPTNASNETLKAYLKTLPIPAKHFIVLALKEGIMFEAVPVPTIAEIFNISESEVMRLYQEAETMITTLTNPIDKLAK